MLAKDIITESIPPLKTSDTGQKALEWMNEFHVTHLPIVNRKQFLGLIAEEDVLDLSQPEEALGNHELSLSKPVVNASQHIYDVIKLIAELKLSLVPVVDEKDNYLGVITLESIISNMAKMDSITEPGGIIILELDLHDYALSEIARHIESNGAHILSSNVHTLEDEKKIELTLKINKTDLRHIVATLERFNYRVKHSYQAEDMDDVLKDRFDSLMKYLDV